MKDNYIALIWIEILKLFRKKKLIIPNKTSQFWNIHNMIFSAETMFTRSKIDLKSISW